ncbi:hypothetical protein B296_00015997 [Ensete ventricosum]|uniref:Uncharacterized protein n=1 Tax=Ensete ventricosum TaxID=4639 RepID=A0A426YPA6_ENSVE|nr:hypothetical protein B296_00015997 [Ensete ventricosum]
MTQLKVAECEDPLMPRWSAIAGSSQFWTEGPLSKEYLHGALYPTLVNRPFQAAKKELKGRADQDLVTTTESHAKELEGDVHKLQGELESLKTQRRRLEEEVGILCSILDGARNDRARLEGDVLSLTEAMTLLEAKLKGERAKVVAAYKASRGFESGLEKMGWVSYEFGYRMALERLRGNIRR